MDLNQLQWPDDFPDQCPPPDAGRCNGPYFRFVSTPIDPVNDFISEFERLERLRAKLQQEGNLAMICMAKGLSVFSSIDGAIAAKKRLPRF